MQGGTDGDFRDFEAQLDRLDSRERQRREHNNKGNIEIVLGDVKPITATPPISHQAEKSKEKLLK